MSSFSHMIVHLMNQPKRWKVCWFLIGSKNISRLLCKSQSNSFLLVKERGTHLKVPRAGAGEASKQASWWKKPPEEGKLVEKKPGLVQAEMNPVLHGLPWLHPTSPGPILCIVGFLQKSILPSKKNQVIWRSLRQ